MRNVLIGEEQSKPFLAYRITGDYIFLNDPKPTNEFILGFIKACQKGRSSYKKSKIYRAYVKK
jgi:hypothetical protein